MSTTDSLTEAFKADLQTRLTAASSDVQAQIYAKTGVDTQNRQVQQGAVAAIGLAKNGFDPSSEADGKSLIDAIAGGAALIIPVGTAIAAYMETMWSVGKALYCPLTNAFAAIGMGARCDAPPCQSTGAVATTASILSSNQGSLPPMRSDSFSAIAISALALYAAKTMNCLGGMPPGVIVDAVVNIWNKTHAGPSVAYYVPPLNTFAGSVSAAIINRWQSYNDTSALGTATGGMDPNVYFAFSPVSSFAPYYNLISKHTDGTYYFGYPSATSSLGTNINQSTEPRYVMVNSGPLVQQKSTAQVIAQGGAIVGAGALVGGLAFAWASGRSAEAVFGGAWNSITGMFKGGIKFPGARERRRRR